MLSSNYWFTKVWEEQRHRRDLKTQAYVDFTHNFMDAHFKGETEETMSRLADAIQRIAIYGDKEVVEAIANIKDVLTNYKNKGEKVPEPEFIHLYTAMIQAMRKKNLPSKESVSDKEISLLAFGKG